MSKYLVITGASKGIGKETAAIFLQAGWSVINISRSPCNIPNVINLTADLSTHNFGKRIETSLLKALKNPSKISVVHNAAVNTKDNICNLEIDMFRENFEVNVVAPLQLNQLLLKKMPSGSSILYIGSTLSEKAVKNAASYVITKHALVGLMRATCQDLAGTGIHTACICPGFTDTEMLRSHLQQDETLIQSVANLTGAKRLINPLEIAEFIFFCANHEVINGSLLHANLGQIEN
jgi:3-oxoacyl-[acyl-carrier protein] reductase